MLVYYNIERCFIYKVCDDGIKKKKRKRKKNVLKYEDRKKQEEQLANNVNGIIYVVKIREQCW